jgi:general secretion pathway protein I
MNGRRPHTLAVVGAPDVHPKLRGSRRRAGFTLVECMAAMVLIGIAMPVVMQGVMAATHAGSAARHRSEAAILANSKLSELIVTGQWDGGVLSGDFGPDWPGYKWQGVVGDWSGDVNAVGLAELDVTVTWIDRGKPTSVTVCGLAYVRPVPST